MRYTGPKFKLCRREGVNLFWSEKYNIKKRRKLPGQHGANQARLTEYGKLLRNKQLFKRLYQLSEKQFKKIVTETALKYAKNHNIGHDEAVFQFLERRLDVIVLRSWFAHSIMQARQMVTHGHFLYNGVKHNIPSVFVKVWDTISVKPGLKDSPLYTSNQEVVQQTPSRCKVNNKNHEIEVLNFPQRDEVTMPVDLLKVIEFYARA